MNDRCLRTHNVDKLRKLYKELGRACYVCGTEYNLSFCCRNNDANVLHRETDDHDLMLLCHVHHRDQPCPKREG